MADQKVRCKQADCGTVFKVPGLSTEATVDHWENKIPSSGSTGSHIPPTKKKHKPESTFDRGIFVRFGGALLGLIAFFWLLGHFVFAPVKPESLSAVSPNIAPADSPLSTATPIEPPIPSVGEQAAAAPPPENKPTSPLPPETISAKPVEDVAAASSPPILSPEPPAEPSVTPPSIPAPTLPQITIDGKFADWSEIVSHSDPPRDTHDVVSRGRDVTPKPIDNPDADLLEYKVMHDAENLYAYFRARGQIGRTQKETEAHERNARKLAAIKNSGRKSSLSESRQRDLESVGQPGRYYVILTIDVDEDDSTGYWLDEGGYYPSTLGYDVNAELEWFDGVVNTGHYLNHGARDESELQTAFMEQTQGKFLKGNDGPYPVGTLTIKPGTYKYYTQWVYHENDTITIVRDKGPAVPGIVRFALSGDNHELEVQFPYKGFLKDPSGKPIVGIGDTLDISFSLEASGEFSRPHEWASDTGDPIEKYMLTPPP